MEPEEKKVCIKCGGEPKALSLFTKSNGKRLNTCKKCSSEYMVKRYAASPELQAESARRERARHAAHVAAVLEYYEGKCACCGETEPKFLTVDHIVPIASYKKRIELGHNRMYSWLVMHNFPPGFQLLCSNCNHGRARNGGICPHQTGSQTISQESSRKCGEAPETLPKRQDIVEPTGKPVADQFSDLHDNPVWPLTDRVQ